MNIDQIVSEINCPAHASNMTDIVNDPDKLKYWKEIAKLWRSSLDCLPERPSCHQ